ncbi:hypothetical protein [Pseudomonas sp. zfem002]|uniref:hypothetical protein n=1 Tax=Pseudomonas sp. zfem002 TaxID=3078197 RepID=UPI00292899DB|nr:hypothetical protein [Pseudomonas sp. zfem002]MDU9394589.1 hypothetical protein [Pseudomonas sp. zfem002]
MTRLALLLALVAAGVSAAPQPENVIDVQHDSRRGVTCWILSGVGISCIPDSQLQAGNERQLSPHERDNGPTPAAGAPQWNDERYSL